MRNFFYKTAVFATIVCMMLNISIPGMLSGIAFAYHEMYVDDNFADNKLPDGWQTVSNNGTVSVNNCSLNIVRTSSGTSGSETKATRYINGNDASSSGVTGKIDVEVTATFPTLGLAQIQIKGSSAIALSVQYQANGILAFNYRNDMNSSSAWVNSSYSFKANQQVKFRAEIDTTTQSLNVWAGNPEVKVVDNKYTRANVSNLQNVYFWLQNSDLITYQINELKVYNSLDNLSEADALKIANDNLNFSDISDESQDAVTANVNLPSKGWYDSLITWESGNPDAISTSGAVYRQNDDFNDVIVPLTATISLGNSSVKKEFVVTVLRVMTERASVNKNYEILNFAMLSSEPIEKVTSSVYFPTGQYGAQITWNSSDPNVISNVGTVNRPNSDQEDKMVILTAHIQNGQYSADKSFNVTVLNMSKFVDPQQMSDEDFFGVWDDANSVWATVGKLNYQYKNKPELAVVEKSVKKHDYDTAKQLLLDYYRNRTDVQKDFSKRDTNIANLAADNIFTYSGWNWYINELDINNDWNTVSVSIDPDKYIIAGGENSFLLMARHKEDSIAEFCSRENEQNVPTLDLIVNGMKRTFTPDKDATIRAGSFGNQNYGKDKIMQVKDSGAPIDDQARRILFGFDLSSLKNSDNISSAVLNLYGRNASGTGDKKIMLVNQQDSSWTENSVVWNSILGYVYSWEGIEGGYDWNNPTGADQEYYYMVNRFYFLGVLANEYYCTKDEFYAYHTIRQMMDFIKDKGLAACDSHGVGLGGYPRSLETGIRLDQWPQSYMAVLKSKYMSADVNTAILKYFWMMGNFLENPSNFDSTNNWGGSQTSGLFQDSLMFPEFKDAVSDDPDSWGNTANSRNDLLAHGLVLNDGSYIESTSSYNNGQLNTFKGIKKLAVLNNRSLSTYFDTVIQKLAHNVIQLYTPSGINVGYGDAECSQRGSMMSDVVTWYNDHELEYMDTYGAKGQEPNYYPGIFTYKTGDPEPNQPSYPSGIYPNSRLTIMRSGWSKDALYSFSAINGAAHNHGHQDDGQMTLAAYGQLLLTDQGRFSYTYTDPRRIWLTSKVAHNTIAINMDPNTGEPLPGQGNIAIPGEPGEINTWITNPAYDFLQESTLQTPGFTHRRNVLFIKPSYWIVSDYVEPNDQKNISQVNNYNQTWHMLPGANISLDNTSKKVSSNFAEGANLQIIPADPNNISASIANGLYSPAEGSLYNAKYASYVKQVKGNVTFDTILYPTPADAGKKVDVDRITLNVPTTTATALKIIAVDDKQQSLAEESYYYLAYDSGAQPIRSFDKFTTDGRMAYIQYNNKHRLKTAIIKDSAYVQDNQTGIKIVSSANPLKEASIQWQDGTIKFSSADTDLNIDNLAIYSDVPVNTLIINDKVTGFKQVSGIVCPDSKQQIEQPVTKGEGAGSSGTFSRSTGTGSTTPTPNATITPTPAAVTPTTDHPIFEDIEQHWAKEDIEDLAALGIVKGDGKRFMPDATVSRAEFVAIIARALGLQEEEYQEKFKDVDLNAWYAGYVQAVYDKGIVSGYDSLFKPEASITREEAAKIIMAAYKTKKGQNDNEAEKLDNLFTDSDLISDWAKEYVISAVQLGLIKGMEDKKFLPQDSTTRAQTAVIINRLLKILQ